MTGILNLLAGAVGVVKDTYFNLVTLLLPGDGTNGAQNNTFLDSSTNNFTITRNGNTTQGTFSPFSQTGWGNFFGGTLSYFTAPSNAAFNMGAGDFTVELFAYDVARNSSGTIWVSKWGNTASVGRSFVLGYMSSTNELFLYGSSDGTTQTNIISTTSHGLNLNTWNHIAATRSGNTFRLFVNGSLVATATNSITLYSSTTPFCVGANYEDVQSSLSNFNVNGYISNLRILKGTAQYTSAFTPPVSPLTAITNTSLLTCQSNRFIDNSSNAFAITVNGTPSVQAFSPFAPTAAYSASTVGGSGYFDGTGDYLSIADNAALDFGTGDFTVEFWAYFNNTISGDTVLIEKRASLGASPWIITADATSGGTVYFYEGTTYRSSIAIPIRAWTHFAFTRSSGTLRIFVNGAQGFSGTVTTNLDTSGNLFIAARLDGSVAFPGYLSDVRLLKGTAQYTAAFTPPTAPLTNITNTSLLLNFANAGITDATAKNDLETVGNVQISTTQSKFGGSSIYLDGTGDYLIPSPNAATLNAFGTGDFTVEFWMNSTSFANADNIKIIFDCRPLSTDGVYPTIYFLSGQIRYFVNSVDRITGSTLNTGQWYHVALCRSGTSTKLFVDGTQVGSTYTDSNNYLCGSNRPVIGCRGHTLGDNNYYGYIDDLRITVGYARYTANFTPPTQAFALQ